MKEYIHQTWLPRNFRTCLDDDGKRSESAGFEIGREPDTMTKNDLRFRQYLPKLGSAVPES